MDPHDRWVTGSKGVLTRAFLMRGGFVVVPASFMGIFPVAGYDGGRLHGLKVSPGGSGIG